MREGIRFEQRIAKSESESEKFALINDYGCGIFSCVFPDVTQYLEI